MNIIEATNISKSFNIVHERQRYVALRDVLVNVFKHPFSLFKTKEKFWALNNVNFTIEQGEVIGIIGRNGAGKSTLLKILSQITPPTTGEIKLRGTVGSLLEVGTGFHPELTGRENIFLNGAILGMKKKEIVKKFDEIVAFAGVEKFIDTPVKYYSSGMYVRLAFSVAAHMEPDILIVDEVLAVGDSDFQKKCIGKMEDITRDKRRTILIVSHNMVTIKQLCSKCILLSKGEVKMVGNTDDVVDAYLNEKSSPTTELATLNNLSAKDIANITGTRFTGIEVSNTQGHKVLKSSDKLQIKLHYTSDSTNPIADARIVITVTSDFSKNIVLRLDSDVSTQTLGGNLAPNGEVICETQDSIDLIEGSYSVDIDFLVGGTSISQIKGASIVDVETDIEHYGYKTHPDRNVADRVIPFTFIQK